MSNQFEQASKLKLRFQSVKGLLTVEDLWELSLEHLDTIAKTVNKKEEESFIGVKSAEDVSTLQFDIVKYVIGVKLKEREERLIMSEKQKQKQRLLELINEKENESLKSLSLEDLRKQLESI